MPLVRITTNVASSSAPMAPNVLLTELSRTVAIAFDKAEEWVMTCLHREASMTFAGTGAATAYVEVKNIGIMDVKKAKEITRVVTTLVARGLGVESTRVYVELTEAVDRLFGWNGDTFA